LRRPPAKYDSVHGNLSGRKMYAIFDNNQSYPEYLISYQGNGAAGMFGGITSAAMGALAGLGGAFSFGTPPAPKSHHYPPKKYYPPGAF